MVLRTNVRVIIPYRHIERSRSNAMMSCLEDLDMMRSLAINQSLATKILANTYLKN